MFVPIYLSIREYANRYVRVTIFPKTYVIRIDSCAHHSASMSGEWDLELLGGNSRNGNYYILATRMLEKNSMSTEVLNLMESSLHIEKKNLFKVSTVFFWKKNY